MRFVHRQDGSLLDHVGRTWICWSLIAANCAIFLLAAGEADATRDAAIRFGLIPAVFNGAYDLPAAYRTIPDFLTLLTYSFLHADGWHLAGNMILLRVFGGPVEDALGHLRFLVLYCLSAVGAGFVQVLAAPLSDVAVIGASGAVAGAVAAYVVLDPFAEIRIPLPGRRGLRFAALWLIGFWALFQAYQALISDAAEVAWWTHLGGFVAGAGLVVVLRPRGVALFGRTTAARPGPGERVDEGATGPIGSAPPNAEGPRV